MLPTSRMRELRDRLAELVDQTRRLLNPEPLELHEMNRVVRFISADNGIATLLSAAVERFYNAVPNSRFAIEPLDVRVLERLRANEADMAFFPATELPPDFHSLRIYLLEKGILVRDGHPVIEAYEKAGVMTWELLNRWPAVCVTCGVKDGGAKERSRDAGWAWCALLHDRSLCGGEDGLYVRGAAHHSQALHDGLAVSVQDSADARGVGTLRAEARLAPLHPHGPLPAVGEGSRGGCGKKRGEASGRDRHVRGVTGACYLMASRMEFGL